jgi:hypothetical protein
MGHFFVTRSESDSGGDGTSFTDLDRHSLTNDEDNGDDFMCDLSYFRRGRLFFENDDSL